MTLDDLIGDLARHGVTVALAESGGLRVRGETLPPALLDALRDHKPAIVAALEDARALAASLYHEGDAETFAAELDRARAAGGLSLVDTCAARLALTVASRWRHATETERVAA